MRGRNNSRVGKLSLFTRVQEPRLADPFPEAPSSREFRHKRPQHDSPAGAVFLSTLAGGIRTLNERAGGVCRADLCTMPN